MPDLTLRFSLLTGRWTRKREGKPLWRTFWVGDTISEAAENRDDRLPSFGSPVNWTMARTMTWGVSLPWNLLVGAALGIWMMIAPDVFGTARGDTTGSFTIADSDHLFGALIAVVAVCATAEVICAIRYLNVLLGMWLVAAPFILSGANAGATANGTVVGLIVAALSLPRGVVKEHFGAWDRYVV